MKSETAHKLANPFKGPYRVITLCDSGVEVVDVGYPQSPPICVALSQVRQYPGEIRVLGEEGTPDSQAMEEDTRGGVTMGQSKMPAGVPPGKNG